MIFNSQSSESSTLTSRDTVLSMLETFPGALFFLDDAKTIVYVNANVQTITRATHKEFLGNQFWRCAPHLVSPSLYQAVMKTKQTQERTEVEYRSPGLQTWLHVQITPTMRGLVLQFHEVREPAQRQEIVPQSEYLCADILENIFDRLAILTPDGMILAINERPLEDAQVRREEIVGRPLAETPWWSYAPAVQQQLRAAIAQASRGVTVHFEARICPQPGRYLDLAMTIIPHRDANTPVQSLLCVARNITEHKHEEALCALVETIPQLVWIAGPDGSLIYNNQRLIDYLAMPLEQVKENGWMTAVHPDNLQRVREAWQATIQTGMPYEEELRLQDGTSGVYRWFLTRGVPIRDEAGQIVRWFGTCTDIDDQKRTEEGLRQSQERVNLLMNSSIIGINIIEGEQIVDANDTFLHMTGYTREDLREGRMSWIHMTSPEYLARTLQAHQELATQQSLMPYEKEFICKDGSRLPVLVGGVLLGHHPYQSIAFVLDNSARKELEQRKDHFLGMASHELKTPITSLKLQTQLLRKQLAKQDLHNAERALSRMESQLNTVIRLVEELLDLSKIQAGKLEYAQETVNLGDVLQEVVEIVQQTQTTHTIVVEHAEHPPFLIGDKARLGQALLNLISNAIKYSQGADRVEVDIKTSEEAVTLSVRDHGIGIPREQREKIFERFYRAVAPHQRAFPGLGMGLYIVSEIVKHHRGTITVESERGKGSTFHVMFPRKSP